MSIEKNLRKILDTISETALRSGRRPEEILLVAVTKGHSLDEIREAYSLGVRDFGENRVDEALQKREQLPSDIRWHFIGKLQKNKVSKVIGKFTLIHSVDSVELAQKIARASVAHGVTTSILLETNTSGESTKSGLTRESWNVHYQELLGIPGIEIHGLMTMAPYTEEESVIRHCFSELRLLSQDLKRFGGDVSTLSMGMTHDFPIAVEEGATLLRLGTALFMPQ